MVGIGDFSFYDQQLAQYSDDRAAAVHSVVWSRKYTLHFARTKSRHRRNSSNAKYRISNFSKENTMFRTTLLSLTASVALATSAFAAGHSKDIVDTAAAAGDFGTLLAAA
jgi:hypothetical protein